MLTRQVPRRVAQTLLRARCGRRTVPFSTSTALGLRMRPIRRNPGRDVSDPQAWTDTKQSRRPPSAKAATGPKTSGTESKPPQKDHTPPSNPPPKDNSQKKSSKPAKRAKGVSVRGLKPFQQNLYLRESIYYQKDSDVPTEVAKTDRPPMATAAKFFEESCRLLYSAETLKHHPKNDNIPEIVVLGASNAGKSSFLNALVGSAEIARVSHRPGKTTTMNAYGIGPRAKLAKDAVRKGEMPPRHSLVLMDTPGYGFKSQADWGRTILQYLQGRKMLRGAVLLLPADKKMQDTDRWMLQTLAGAKTRTLVVLTKADKAGDGWEAGCARLAKEAREDMVWMKTSAASSWREGSDRAVDVYATAADMGVSTKLGNGGGMGGARLAILEMAGFTLGEKVEQQEETKEYSGAIVSFDDIVWKT